MKKNLLSIAIIISIVFFCSFKFIGSNEKIVTIDRDGILSDTSHVQKFSREETYGHHMQSFEISIKANDRLIVEATSLHFTPLLILQNSSGKKKMFSAKKGFSLGPVIDSTFTEAGSYIVFVSSSMESATGLFNLWISTAQPDAIALPSDENLKSRFSYLTDQALTKFYFMPQGPVSKDREADCGFEFFGGKKAILATILFTSYQQELYSGTDLNEAKKQFSDYKKLLIETIGDGWKTIDKPGEYQILNFEAEKCLRTEECVVNSIASIDLSKRNDKYIVTFTFNP